ncbi:CdaR family transcriptional regulator [Ursidibacter arcticus]
MKLNKTIAQLIVRRTMQIIPNSVNVMDENGIIIASGDVARLNQRHTGAILVLRNNRAIEIDDELAKKWNYEARAGINLPITYLGSNIGVVGISGDPNNVRPYAELVKMAAELIVEQSALLEKERWDRRYKEEFVLQLVRGGLSHKQISQQATFFQLEARAYTVILIKLQSATAENLQLLLAHFEHHFSNIATAVVDLDKVILIYPLTHNLDALKRSKILLELIPNTLSIGNYRIVVGMSVSTLSQLDFAYQTALQTLNYVEGIHSKKILHFFLDYKLPALLADFVHSWQGKELLAPFHTLIEHDDCRLLLKTLQQYFLSNCDLSHASQKLFIHPNTLRYRLNKIEQITSLFFNKIDDKFILFLGAVSLK